MKAVIYARYSCAAQNEQSIEGQLRECYDYAKKHEFTIVETYIDRAISGKTDDREAFQRMIRDSDRQAFDFVLLYKMDRFARNRYDSAIYKAKLKKNGVKVLYVKECIPDGPEGIILESLLEGMAEYYSAELSQKVRRGMLENAHKCYSTGGYIPLGYKIVDKCYTLNEEQLPTVRYIFENYDNGVAVKDICDELNCRGVKTSIGGTFNKNSLRRILKNKKYIGIYENQGVCIDNGVPAIIDTDLFKRVQERVQFNCCSPASGKAKEKYLLSGKLYCGHCGAGMVGESGTGKSGVKHYYYACINKRRTKTCQKKNIKKQWLENLVVVETIRHILQPDRIAYIAKRCMEIYQGESTENNELIYLHKQLSDIKKSIANLLNAIEQGIITKSTKERLATLEISQENLEFKIAMTDIKRPALTEKQIIFMLSKFQRETSENLERYNEDIIECFVNSVYLYDDKLFITYNLTNEKSDLLRSDLENLHGNTANAVFCRSDLNLLGDPPRNRTVNLLIKSQLLCQLS